MSYLYKRTSQDGEQTFYYSGAGEVVAIVRQKSNGSGFWIRDTYRSQISESGASEHATRAAAEGAAETGFDVIDKGRQVRL